MDGWEPEAGQLEDVGGSEDPGGQKSCPSSRMGLAFPSVHPREQTAATQEAGEGPSQPLLQTYGVWTDTESGRFQESRVSDFLQASTRPLIKERRAGVISSMRPGRGWDEVMRLCC